MCGGIATGSRFPGEDEREVLAHKPRTKYGRGIRGSCLGFSKEEIIYICSVYDSKSKTIDALQEKWPSRPRWHFRRVAQKFGLSKPAPPRWTEWEKTFLITKRHLLSPKHMGERLGRSEVAVKLKMKRLGYNWIQSVDGFFTMRAVARLFGVGDKCPGWWIDEGWLRGDRFPTKLGPYYPRRISYEAICDFIEDERYWHVWEAERMKPGNLKEYAGEIRDGREHFLTTGQLGRLTFYTHRWIRELIARGEIEAKKHGPNWKISVQEAQRFMQRERQRKVG